MFDSDDLRSRNPYGAKLGTQLLNPDGTFKAVSIAIPAGQQLADHTAPSPALLFMIKGQAKFSSRNSRPLRVDWPDATTRVVPCP